METIENYLDKTESATKKIFEGIDDYINILRESRSPVFVSGILDDEERKKEYEKWATEHEEEIKAFLDAQNKYVDESFAMSTLCSSLLQIAAMGIQKYSKNTEVAEGFSSLIKEGSKPAKFCIGRLERDIPIGLIIYAGRNQFNHLDDKLRELNTSIFEKLCQIESFSNKGTFYRDPAFDLNNEMLVSYASNITSLLGWRSYDNYYNDVRDMFL
ncbi:MAG: hypothetical protein JAZ13_06290 [Candidatus Thiodiazotropha taylori]|nr:hypothetical protein [Candidatus Thiodiazotropha taylori]